MTHPECGAPLCEAAVHGFGNVALSLCCLSSILLEIETGTQIPANSKSRIGGFVVSLCPDSGASNTLTHDCVPSVLIPSSCAPTLNSCCVKS